MKTCGALLVLLCCSLAQLRGETISENDITHQGLHTGAESRENEVLGAAERTEATDTDTTSTQQTCQPDIHTVLREMTALVTELKVELRHTEKQVGDLETRLRASESKAEAMETRLRASETKADTMETRLRASETKADTMETRLRASEKTVEEQRAVIKELKEKQEEQTGSLNMTESQVEELRREREERKVSFYASLLASGSGNTGPFSTQTSLVYRRVFTNVGNAYNKNTGVFTAPVRGVYHFGVSLHGVGQASTRSEVFIYKNAERVSVAKIHQPSHTVSASNSASLLLEVGDVVYARLQDSSWVHDNHNYPFTTFSGHLLFPM